MRPALLVLGGGAAGVAAAHEAARSGYEVDLVERSGRLGGLHQSHVYDGRVYDIGAFVFSDSHPLVQTFPGARKAFVPAAFEPVRVTPRGTYDRYPLSLRGYVHDNGMVRSLLDAADYVRWALRRTPAASVADYASSCMGRLVYQRCGLQSYIERLYGLRDEEIALEMATHRLAVFKEYTPAKVMRRWIDQRIHPRVPHELARHPDGFGAVYRAIAGDLGRLGVRVETGSPPARLHRARDGFVLESGTRWREYAVVVSTIPVSAALDLLGEAPQGEYEAMFLHSLFFTGQVIPRGTVFFNFTARAAWKRATVFSRLYRSDAPGDHLTVEVTRHTAGGTAACAEEFIEHATDLDFVRGLRLVGSVVTPDAYPVFRRGRAAARNGDRQKLKDAGIRIAGRQGRFEYLSSTDAVRQGRSAIHG